MSSAELKEKLIEHIRKTEDKHLLEEISHLFELQEPDTIYQLNDQQKKDVSEAKEQIRNKQFLSNEDADKDIDEWLSK